MRKMIIDTDTGSDDAVALMMALTSPEIDVLGITTVCGNVPQDLATKNALMTVQICGKDTPVYPGASSPLFRELVTAVNVHGQDGMGDMDLIHPLVQPKQMHAIDYILSMVEAYPQEIELVMLGPATNIALAILKSPETMKKIKHIYSMGTSGFGPGNTTPVAEFNVYVDAEAYQVILQSQIPLTIIGFDLCIGDAAWNKQDMQRIASSGTVGKFAVTCNQELLNYNLRNSRSYVVDLPDAVAMGVALWEDIVLEKCSAYCYCCTKEAPAYGQVIIYDPCAGLSIDQDLPPANAAVIKKIDTQLFKRRLEKLLTKQPSPKESSVL